MVNLDIIRDTLLKYKDRYRWLDVFTANVDEFSNPDHHGRFTSLGDNKLRAVVGPDILEAQLIPEASVARFELVQNTAAAPIIGASVGALIGASLADKEEAPTGAIFGLLVGGFAGALAQSAARPDKILTLMFDPSKGGWVAYNGPYVSWAKEALRAS